MGPKFRLGLSSRQCKERNHIQYSNTSNYLIPGSPPDKDKTAQVDLRKFFCKSLQGRQCYVLSGVLHLKSAVNASSIFSPSETKFLEPQSHCNRTHSRMPWLQDDDMRPKAKAYLQEGSQSRPLLAHRPLEASVLPRRIFPRRNFRAVDCSRWIWGSVGHCKRFTALHVYEVSPLV